MIIVVLGAGLERQPRRAPLRAWAGMKTTLRVRAAAELWKTDPDSILIMSGGGSPVSEAEAMCDEICADPFNIPADTIIVETASIDTASNVRNVVRLLRERNMPTNDIAVVSGSNLLRATRYFRAWGIRVRPCPTTGEPPLTGRDRLREGILLLLQIVDRTGRFPTWWKRRHH